MRDELSGNYRAGRRACGWRLAVWLRPRGAGAQPFTYEDNTGWISLFDGQACSNGWDGDTRFWSVKDREPSMCRPTTARKPDRHHLPDLARRRRFGLHAQVRIEGHRQRERRRAVSQLPDRR